MILVLYQLLALLLSPVWLVWMLIRVRRRQEKPNWRERFGLYSGFEGDRARIWIHAVSVGEVLAVLPVLRRLRDEASQVEIVLSVTTSSGHRTAREQAANFIDRLVYLPIDFGLGPWIALGRVKPRVVAIMETELWLNFLTAAQRLGAETMVINGRLSERRMPTALRMRPYYRAIFGSVDQVLVQTPDDAQRFQALGAPYAHVMGNTKFDEALGGLTDSTDWRSELNLREGKPVLVIGSTRGEAEESLVLEAVSRIGLDRLSVIHAPRHLERAEPLSTKVTGAFGSCARRSLGQIGPYLVLDTYGELGKVYAIADVVVIGGSFEPLGGQNLLQPLAHGKPVIHGPSMYNFQDVADAAQGAGATLVVDSAEALHTALERLLGDPELRSRMGIAARDFIAGHAGASRRYADAILKAAQ